MNKNTPQLAAVLSLFAVAMASRIYTPFAGAGNAWLQNFSPIAAICLCGAIYFSRKTALLLPLAIVFLSDIFLDAHYSRSIFSIESISRYIALPLVIALGWAIRKKGSTWMAIPASVLGSFIFYVITNTGSWLTEAGYAKTFAGWMQALTTGLPGYAPTWTFFRSTFVSDLLFTTLFVLCMAATASRTPEQQPAHAQPAVS